MARVLGIDYGERRVGLALSDPTRTIAQPLPTLVRRRGKRPPWAPVLELLLRHEVAHVVLGLPLTMSGKESDWTREVRAFGDELSRRSGRAVTYIDERLTSVRAERAVRSAGLRRMQRERKDLVDATAAVLILQAFLDGQAGEPPPATEAG